MKIQLLESVFHDETRRFFPDAFSPVFFIPEDDGELGVAVDGVQVLQEIFPMCLPLPFSTIASTRSFFCDRTRVTYSIASSRVYGYT